MKKVAYTTRTGQKFFKPVISEHKLTNIMFSDMSGAGWCLACGRDTDGVEPDARKYTCDSCGEKKVYGIPELVMMNLVVVS
jgi:hypothetical protein